MESICRTRTSALTFLTVAAFTAFLADNPIFAQEKETSGPNPKSVLQDSGRALDAGSVAVLRPRQILSSPAAKLLPLETIRTLLIANDGIDPVSVENATAFVQFFRTGAPTEFAITLRFNRAVKLTDFAPRPRASTRPGNINGKEYLAGLFPNKASFYLMDDTTLIIATDASLRSVISGKQDERAKYVASKITKVGGSFELYASLDTVTIQVLLLPLVMGDKIPHGFTEATMALYSVRETEISLNLSDDDPLSIRLYCNNEQAAQELEKKFSEGIENWLKHRLMYAPSIASADDTLNQSIQRDRQRLLEQWSHGLRPNRDRNTVRFFEGLTDHAIANQLLVWRAIQEFDETWLPGLTSLLPRASRDNLTAIASAINKYTNASNRMPAHAIYGKSGGKPLLSWRVELLPYLGQQHLYSLFHLDEPWDSPHNLKLVPLMPTVFRNPDVEPQLGKTNYLAVVGDHCAFDGSQRGARWQSFVDGTARTIIVVEADAEKSVVWTQPEELQFNSENPKSGLGSMRNGSFLAMFGDLSVKSVPANAKGEVLKAMFTRNGREKVDFPLGD